MLLNIKNISKSFPGVKALDNVNLEINEGEVHALVGENGAGKSTLMSIVSGILKADNGEIQINGKKVEINKPKKAIDLGISMIFQEINLSPNLTIAENIFIEKLPRVKRYPVVDWKRLYSESKKILKEVGLDIDPKTKMFNLSVSQTQMVQLSKSISRIPEVIIMDEPNSSISEAETEKLFGCIHKFKSKNNSVIYISHRLDDIFQIADRVTVLRDGKIVDTLNIKDTNKEELISKMVGRYLDQIFVKRKVKKGNEVLKVEKLSKENMFNNIDFSLNQGEVVGFYGLIGSGRTELALSLFGLWSIDSGEVYLNNKKVIIKSPNDAMKKGIGYLSEDRIDKSIFPTLNIRENITISSLKKYSYSIFTNNRAELKTTNKYIDRLKIKISSIGQKAMSLSGGNQQKLVVSRLLALNTRILILDEPTRGIDVGAKAEIHSLMDELAENHIGIIFISSDLPEVSAISDRVIVMREGEISGIFPGQGETTQKTLLRAASPN